MLFKTKFRPIKSYRKFGLKLNCFNRPDSDLILICSNRISKFCLFHAEGQIYTQSLLNLIFILIKLFIYTLFIEIHSFYKSALLFKLNLNVESI